MKDLNNKSYSVLIVDQSLFQSLNFIILEASYMLRTKVVNKCTLNMVSKVKK